MDTTLKGKLAIIDKFGSVRAVIQHIANNDLDKFGSGMQDLIKQAAEEVEEVKDALLYYMGESIPDDIQKQITQPQEIVEASEGFTAGVDDPLGNAVLWVSDEDETDGVSNPANVAAMVTADAKQCGCICMIATVNDNNRFILKNYEPCP